MKGNLTKDTLTRENAFSVKIQLKFIEEAKIELLKLHKAGDKLETKSSKCVLKVAVHSLYTSI